MHCYDHRIQVLTNPPHSAARVMRATGSEWHYTCHNPMRAELSVATLTNVNITLVYTPLNKWPFMLSTEPKLLSIQCLSSVRQIYYLIGQGRNEMANQSIFCSFHHIWPRKPSFNRAGNIQVKFEFWARSVKNKTLGTHCIMLRSFLQLSIV